MPAAFKWGVGLGWGKEEKNLWMELSEDPLESSVLDHREIQFLTIEAHFS